MIVRRIYRVPFPTDKGEIIMEVYGMEGFCTVCHGVFTFPLSIFETQHLLTCEGKIISNLTLAEWWSRGN